jgi:membrane protein insertase Oxa1/YidC/SpoIIIJ
LPKSKRKENQSFQEDLAHNLNLQMRYLTPITIIIVGYFSAVIALYLTASNTFMIAQELLVRRKLEREAQI